jgi:gamma-glutamyltranspeptidase/glutathione hydrolase
MSPSFDKFSSRRSVVYSTKGIVSSSQPTACQAGIEILKKGGNAADAAVATALALGVVEPMSTGLGGDAFCLFWNNTTKSLSAINGSGGAPAALTLEACRNLGLHGTSIPGNSVHAVTVPGAVAAMLDTIDMFGSANLEREEIFYPAIGLAEQGFPVSEVTADQWVEVEDKLQEDYPNGAELLIDGHNAPRAGDYFRNPNLAETLKEVAAKGRAGFYKGNIAQSIVDTVQNEGGLLTLEDLAQHQSSYEAPIGLKFKDVEIFECQPNGAGIVALMALKYIQELEKGNKIPPVEEIEHNSAEYLHVIIEALRHAYSDGYKYIADPRAGINSQSLLRDDYWDAIASSFSPHQADLSITHDSPFTGSDTVYLTASDAQGNACSFITSNASNFGCGIVVKGRGFPLQNRGTGFHLVDRSPNCIAPGKRPYHTIIPAMIVRNGELYASYGVMGGFMQPQGHLQVLLNLVCFGHTPQEALDAPRVCIRAGAHLDDDPTKQKEHTTHRSEVFVEDGVSATVLDKLVSYGHRVESVVGWKRAMFGRGQIIQPKYSNGVLVYHAGSDLRGDGHAVPLI